MEVMDKQSALDYINQMFPTGLFFSLFIDFFYFKDFNFRDFLV